MGANTEPAVDLVPNAELLRSLDGVEYDSDSAGFFGEHVVDGGGAELGKLDEGDLPLGAIFPMGGDEGELGDFGANPLGAGVDSHHPKHAEIERKAHGHE